MKNVYVFLADGFEEIEALTVVDILRRAGVNAVTVSVVEKRMVNGSHGIRTEADIMFDGIRPEEADMLVLPGGMPGTLNLRDHEGLRELLFDFDRKEKYIAAICAAPSILGGMGLLREKAACSYPSFENQLDCRKICQDPTVQDGHIITGRGMGAAIEFALKLTSVLCGEAKAEEIAGAIVYEHPVQG